MFMSQVLTKRRGRLHGEFHPAIGVETLARLSKQIPLIKSWRLRLRRKFQPGLKCNSHRNHGCGQQKPEGTSSAVFEVGTAAKCCEFKRYVLRLDSMFTRVTRVTELR